MKNRSIQIYILRELIGNEFKVPISHFDETIQNSEDMQGLIDLGLVIIGLYNYELSYKAKEDYKSILK